jgi:hypothetical protein
MGLADSCGMPLPPTTVRAMSGRGERWSGSGVRHSVLVDWALRRVRREKEDEEEKMSHVLFLKKKILLFRRVYFLLGPHLLMFALHASPFPFHSNSRLPATKSSMASTSTRAHDPFKKIGPPCVEVSLGCSSSSQGCVPVQECHSQFCPVALKYWRPVIRMRPGRAANTIRHV